MQISRLQAKIAEITSSHGVSLDEEEMSDFCQIVKEEDEKVKQEYPEGSFQRIFWEQQKEAAKRSGCGIRWHPIMIRWCIYLKHQSSKAYEAIRESGCVHLPSQRTLRDYTNCVKASAGFSVEVDRQLMQAARLTTCHGWQKLVVLLLDEMHVREDLVYNKHTGKMIGFVNLGEVSNHLIAFERSLQGHQEEDRVLAKSMMVMMVRGLFTPLRYAYAQFPCEKITGSLLFHPFWQAVHRLERMGLKVKVVETQKSYVLQFC